MDEFVWGSKSVKDIDRRLISKKQSCRLLTASAVKHGRDASSFKPVRTRNHGKGLAIVAATQPRGAVAAKARLRTALGFNERAGSVFRAANVRTNAPIYV